MVARIIVTVAAVFWSIKAIQMFGCASVTFDGIAGGCFDVPAGSAGGGYFVGWEAGLVVLTMAIGALAWIWIVPRVRRLMASRPDNAGSAAAE